MSSTGTSPTYSEGMPSSKDEVLICLLGGEIPPAGRTGTQSFMQRRRASFSKQRSETDPHADRMLQGHFSID